MAGRTRSIVAMELNPAFLKLVEIFPEDNRVASVLVEPLESGRWENDAYLQEQIGSALRRMRADVAEGVCSVSAGRALLRLVEIPEGEDNASDALQWDMEQYLGRPLDEYLMDSQPLGAGNGRCYLVAAHLRREVERLKRVLESSGLPLAVVDVDALAALNAFVANYPMLQAQKTLLIKADADMLLCIRAQQGELLACDAFPIAVEVESDAGLLEVVRGIRAYFEALGGEDAPDGVVLCGDWAASESFCAAVEAALPAPFICLDAFKEMGFTEGFSSPAAFMPAAAQCAAALGLALRRPGDC